MMQLEFPFTPKKESWEPPFDGKPCPMCPGVVRNLSAVAHNMTWRLKQREHVAKGWSKLDDLESAVADVTRLSVQNDALKRLVAAARGLVMAARARHAAAAWLAVDALESASEAVQPLADAHFADRAHSHGY